MDTNVTYKPFSRSCIFYELAYAYFSSLGYKNFVITFYSNYIYLLGRTISNDVRAHKSHVLVIFLNNAH